MSRVQAVIAALVASSLIGAAAVAGPPSFTITAQVEPADAGIVLLDPQKDAYKRNNIVNVTAVPSEPWSTVWGVVPEMLPFAPARYSSV